MVCSHFLRTFYKSFDKRSVRVCEWTMYLCCNYYNECIEENRNMCTQVCRCDTEWVCTNCINIEKSDLAQNKWNPLALSQPLSQLCTNIRKILWQASTRYAYTATHTHARIRRAERKTKISMFNVHVIYRVRNAFSFYSVLYWQWGSLNKISRFEMFF